MGKKDLPETFAAAAPSMTTEDLKAVVLESTYTAENTKRMRDEDSAYQDAKEDYKAIADGFNDVIKMHKAKATYALGVLKERGVELTRQGS
jgi:hypothetical protein